MQAVGKANYCQYTGVHIKTHEIVARIIEQDRDIHVIRWPHLKSIDINNLPLE